MHILQPFESLHIDHIGQLSHPRVILVMIDAFSRWDELFPTKTMGTSEAAVLAEPQGNSFTHLEKASMSGECRTSNGLYEAQVNR